MDNRDNARINYGELLLELLKDVAAIKAHQMEIKDDLKLHMKRTAQVETELKYLHRQINLAHGAIAFITIIGVLAGIVKTFSV